MLLLPGYIYAILLYYIARCPKCLDESIPTYPYNYISIYTAMKIGSASNNFLFVINEFLNNSEANGFLYYVDYKHITKLSYFICTNSSFLNYEKKKYEKKKEIRRRRKVLCNITKSYKFIWIYLHSIRIDIIAIFACTFG